MPFHHGAVCLSVDLRADTHIQECTRGRFSGAVLEVMVVDADAHM
jgi:hypothetical protein